MKKLMAMALVAAVTGIGYSQDAAPLSALKPDKVQMKAIREAQRKERKEKKLEEQALKRGISVAELKDEIAKCEAKSVGLTVEQWNSLDEDGKRTRREEAAREKREAADKKRAEKAGLSVEEWRKQQEAKKAEARAKRAEAKEKDKKEAAVPAGDSSVGGAEK